MTATDYTNVNVLLDQIVANAAPDLNGHPSLQVAQLGAGNFAIMWLENGAAGPELHGVYYTLPPDAAALEVVLPGGDGWTAIPIAPIPLHAGFTGEFHLAGLGEDNPDIVLTYTATDVAGTTGVYARHIEGLANGAPEQVFGSSPDFLVNTTRQAIKRAVPSPA